MLQLPAFVLAVVLVAASPGPAMVLVLRRAALHGGRGAVPTVLGLEAGLYAWALLAAAGLAALVAASEVAYVVLRVVGAGVLVALGVRAWVGLWRERQDLGTPGEDTADRTGGTDGTRRRFFEGALVQLANPKAAVFMVAFYPQLVPDGRPLLATTAMLALLQVAIETVLYVGLAAAVGRAGGWLRRRRVRRGMEGASGAVLVGLGVRVALGHR